MKKACVVLLCIGIIAAGILFSGCTTKNGKQTINYQRKLQNYLPADSTGTRPSGTIDLSDGAKTKYDANLGPQELNFDIKIHDPYKY
jgi:hypothetical protein